LLDRLADRAENNARVLQFLAEGGCHRDAVKHRVHRDLARALDPGENLLLLDRDAELFIDAQDFGIDLVEAAELFLRLGLGIIIGVLIVDHRNVELGPVGRFHLFPQAKGFQPPVEHPLRLALLVRNEAYRVFIEPLGRKILLDVRRPAELVGACLVDRLLRLGIHRLALCIIVGGFHCFSHSIIPPLIRSCRAQSRHSARCHRLSAAGQKSAVHPEPAEGREMDGDPYVVKPRPTS